MVCQGTNSNPFFKKLLSSRRKSSSDHEKGGLFGDGSSLCSSLSDCCRIQAEIPGLLFRVHHQTKRESCYLLYSWQNVLGREQVLPEFLIILSLHGKGSKEAYMQRVKPAIVVGGGIAGTTCASHLSSLIPNLPIILIEAQSTVKVSSNPIDVTQLAADVSVEIDESRAWCEKKRIRFLQGHAVNLEPGLLTTESGLCQPFSVCCIATGASPFIPTPLKALEFQNVILTLRDSDSVQQLAHSLSGARTVLIIGAGGIAMELVHEISNCRVVWLFRNHIGGSFFDQRAANALSSVFNIDEPCRKDYVQELNTSKASGIINGMGSEEENLNKIETKNTSKASVSASAVGPQWLRVRDRPLLCNKAGIVCKDQNPIPFLHGRSEKIVNILKGCDVVKLYRDVKEEWPVIVSLSNGEFVGCDLIVVATGVTANVDWLSDSAIDLAPYSEGRDGGIVIKAGSMASSMPCVFAAGDCASVLPTEGSDWFQLRLWSQALTAGRVAAQNMAERLGFGEAYVGLEFDIFAHTTKFFGKRVVLLGRYNAQGLGNGYKEYERFGEDYIRVVVKDGRVRGALLVGDVDSAEVLENLILTQLNVEWLGERIVDKETDLEDYFD